MDRLEKELIMESIDQIIANVLHKYTLMESEGKVDNFLSNPKNLEAMKQAIKSDPEITDKSIEPKDLMLDWDNKSPIISKNIQWVAKQYINNQFHAFDIDRLAEDLTKFTKYAKNNKDIFPSTDLNSYTYSNLKPLLSQIDDNDLSRMGSSQKRSFKQAGKEDAKKVYEDNDFLILIPTSEAGAIYWGSGTNWCTASNTTNYFNHYNSMGPLYILISKKNPEEKYQFHFESDQFMDKSDDNINLYRFVAQYPFIKQFFRNEKDLDKSDPKNWIWYDSNQLTDEDYLLGLKQDGLALRYIPENRRTYEMCLEALENAPGVWSDIPLEFRTEELCLKIPSYLLDIIIFPEQIQNSKEFWLKYISENPTINTLTKIPEEFNKDYDVYKQLIKTRLFLGDLSDLEVELLNNRKNREDLGKEIETLFNSDKYQEEIIDRFKGFIPEETLLKIREDLIKEVEDLFKHNR